ncbi:hypothetical protein Tco_1549652 [Tanacetum coccineum]
MCGAISKMKFPISKGETMHAPVLALPDGPDDFWSIVMHRNKVLGGASDAAGQSGLAYSSRHLKLPSRSLPTYCEGTTKQRDGKVLCQRSCSETWLCRVSHLQTVMVNSRSHLGKLFKKRWVQTIDIEYKLTNLRPTSDVRYILERWRICFELVVMDLLETESQLIVPQNCARTIIRWFKLRKIDRRRSRQKIYADMRRKPLDSKLETVCYYKRCWTRRISAEVPGSKCVHDMFHVSNLKKCLANPDVQVPLDEIEIDENLRFVEEPIEIVERDVKKLKRRRIPLVKVSWISRKELSILREGRGPHSGRIIRIFF